MDQSRVLLIVRQFWENAIKLLLEDPQQFPAKKSVCSLDRWLGV